ncbi:hypothetical protein G6L33_11140 [Agrobacterium rhizogenes]|nr:hypothetical protein [Rhizobium rhizogenes]NTH64406.1 hypothetical protein [Rhizobium rhizogenes]NTJ32086.1 hypothetical protein [Rhizobium rhizogenes]
MSVHPVRATHEYLKKVASTRDPVKALSEFVWNALDADATKVEVKLPRNGLGGIERIEIADDGIGITLERATRDFPNIGDSWKLSSKTSGNKRVLHGKEGRGRLRFYSLAGLARWDSVYKGTGANLSLQIKINGDHLDRADIPEPVETQTGETGTVVTLDNLKETFDWLAGQDARAEFDAIFAPYVLQYPNAKVIFDGVPVDPAKTIERSTDLPTQSIVCPGGTVVNDLSLKVIEWQVKSGTSRKIYFGGESGIVLGSQAAGITAPGFDFSVYASSPFFEEIAKANLLEFDNLSDPAFTTVVTYIKDQVTDYFRERQAERSAELIDDFKAAGIYPYEGDPLDDIEKRERQVFEIATHAVSTYSREFKYAENPIKKMTLRLLREALKHNPDSISRILQAVFNLPKNRQDEFSGLLDKTELSNIIVASNLIGDRVVALEVLKQLVFDPSTRRNAKERGELDVLIRDQTWIFGEDFHITMPEAGLTKIMHRVAEELGKPRSKKSVLKKPDGKSGRIDQFLGRIVPHPNQSHREFLIVELKRPNIIVGRKELSQVEDYMSALVNQPDFNTTYTSWTFFLVTTEYDEVAKERATQAGWPVGLVVNKSNCKIWLKTWAEIIRDSESRLQFIQEKLKIEVADEIIDQRIAQLKSSYVR